MQPIQELMARIRWDPLFGKGEFIVGYYDRVSEGVIKVRLQDLDFDPDDHFGFQLIDDEGEVHNIPYHRIREVYKNDRLIWQRHHPD